MKLLILFLLLIPAVSADSSFFDNPNDMFIMGDLPIVTPGAGSSGGVQMGGIDENVSVPYKIDDGFKDVKGKIGGIITSLKIFYDDYISKNALKIIVLLIILILIYFYFNSVIETTFSFLSTLISSTITTIVLLFEFILDAVYLLIEVPFLLLIVVFLLVVFIVVMFL